jgi:hypothetical protein
MPAESAAPARSAPRLHHGGPHHPHAMHGYIHHQDHYHHRPADFMPGIFFGAGLFDLSALNDILSKHGYSKLDSLTPVLGGELRAIHPCGMVFGVTGAAIFGIKGDGPDSLKTEWSGGYGLVDAGYAPVRLPGFALSLSAAIGGYRTRFDVMNKSEANFADVLDMPRRELSLTSGGLLFGLLLRVDGRIPVGDVRNDRQGYIALGLRLTGLWGPALSDWSSASSGTDINNGPSARLTGAHAALVVGWGSFAANGAGP